MIESKKVGLAHALKDEKGGRAVTGIGNLQIALHFKNGQSEDGGARWSCLSQQKRQARLVTFVGQQSRISFAMESSATQQTSPVNRHRGRCCSE
jgi:hypothetical protein